MVKLSIIYLLTNNHLAPCSVELKTNIWSHYECLLNDQTNINNLQTLSQGKASYLHVN